MTTNLVDASKSTRTVELDIGYEVVLPIFINSDSGLLYEISKTVMFGSKRKQLTSDQPFKLKLETLFPNTNAVTLSFYVYFLRGKELTVVTRTSLVDCLNLYSLNGDVNFFETLLRSLFKLWTVLSPVLYSNKIPDEVKWKLWLRCPLQLLPDHCLENQDFMYSWRQRQDNKYLLVNGDEIFDSEHTEVEEIVDEEGEGQVQSEGRHFNIVKTTSYTRQHDDTNISDQFVQEMYDDRVMTTITRIGYNGGIQGQEIHTVPLGLTSKTSSVFINGDLNGPHKYYTNNTLKGEAYEIDSFKQGLEIIYRSSSSSSSGSGDGDNSILLVSLTRRWKDNKVIEQVIYNKDGSYLVSNYISDDTVSGKPLEHRFYDSHGRLTRLITHPMERVTKHDVLYDSNGGVVSDTIYGENVRYATMDDAWR